MVRVCPNIMWQVLEVDKNRLRTGMARWYQAIANEAAEPKVSHLPRDWCSRIYRVREV